MSLSSFHPVVRAWFEESFGTPSPPQARGWPVIARGQSALILAPTGSGKTLAAFLKCLDQLYQEPVREPGVKVLYISPLKALNNDVHKNLEIPLRGIEAKAREMGFDLPHLTTAVRTGDTSPRERAAMVRRPPDLLITTPESLYLLLTSKARQMLRTVRYVIVDEIHAVCGTKRGVHLSLSLERMEALTAAPPIRIGLSATQRPLEEIARYLGGVGRQVQVIDTGTRRQLDLLAEVPVDDMRALPDNTIWSAIYPRLLELIREHRSTLVFVNYRGLAERTAGRLNELAGEEVARVHHGSMSREAREQVEADLKAGRLRCLVATASLELGIDVGAIDLVVQVESPKSAARGLQRVGRAGHIVGAASKGRLLPKHRGDLVEMAAILREMKRGQVEETHIPTGALDVLAQQITAMAALDDWSVDDLFALVRRSYCYRDLTRQQLDSVLEMLAGRYPAEEFREMRPRIVWERESGIIRAREGTRSLAVLSGGTIPDRGYYGVYIHGTAVKLGEMDEEFVYESRVGDVFLLGTASWRVQSIEHDRITVTEAYGMMPKMPFWKGDGLGRPYSMGVLVGAFLREVAGQLDDPALPAWLKTECALDPRAASNLVSYLRDQLDSLGVLPTDRQVVAEQYTDEMGDLRVIIHSPFGERVHMAWAIVLKHRIRQTLGLEAELTQTDDAILFRLPGANRSLSLESLLRVTPNEATDALVEEISYTPLFGAYFRMNAQRSLVLPRPRPGRRQPFWLQRLKASDLLQVARKYGSYPVVLETYREVLRDVLDLQGLSQVLQGLVSGEIGLEVMETVTPSPMAASVLMKFLGQYMYEGETPKAERRSALLSMNRELLREVLGAEELRELLDERAIHEVHQRLQRLHPDWQPRNADETEDLLHQVGDLTAAELTDRGVKPEWLNALAATRRARTIPINGEERWIAAGDYGLYGDLVGHAGAVIRRFARSRGPFVPNQICSRYGFSPETVARYLALLQAESIVARGEYTPGVTDQEYCDTDVLQQIYRRTLARLRREIEPVDKEAYTRFLAAWQGVAPVTEAAGGVRSGSPAKSSPRALLKTLERLQGLPLPAGAWEREILPRRVPGYQPLWLDQLCATGECYFAFLPGNKLAFYLPDRIAAFAPRLMAEPSELTPEQALVLRGLQDAGADFLGGLARTTGLTPPVVLEALTDLTRTGLVTNDTFAPVRHLVQTGKPAARRGRPLSLQAGTGRWSLTARLVQPAGDAAEIYTQVLLDRYGVVTREAVQAEDGPIPWSEVLTVLKRMELRGQVRQGYFIRELSGAQFALPEAVEKLRSARDETPGSLHLLGACDPANPYGTLFPSAGPQRVPTAFLVLENGEPVLGIEGMGKRLMPLVPLEPERLQAVLSCLKGLLDGAPGVRLRRVEVERWGDVPIGQSEAGPVLEALGFERMPTKLVLYR